MEIKYCWRCREDMPMLTDDELKLCYEARNKGKDFVLNEIERKGVKDYVWLEDNVVFQQLRYFVEMYRVITGFPETNPNAIFHHVISLYGPDCPNCKKPLRTPIARYCVYCGLGKENLDIDQRPLTEKRPDLF
jgi:hypothetical protein